MLDLAVTRLIELHEGERALINSTELIKVVSIDDPKHSVVLALPEAMAPKIYNLNSREYSRVTDTDHIILLIGNKIKLADGTTVMAVRLNRFGKTCVRLSIKTRSQLMADALNVITISK